MNQDRLHYLLHTVVPHLEKMETIDQWQSTIGDRMVWRWAR